MTAFHQNARNQSGVPQKRQQRVGTRPESDYASATAISDLTARLDAAEAALADHATRLAAAEATILDHEARIAALEP